MSASPSLLSLLRRRLHGVRWLFALMLMAKLALGTACLAADGNTASVAGVAQAVMVASVDADSSGDCWHEGSGGCHCNCTHATPLLSTFVLDPMAPLASHRFIAPSVDTRATPWRNPLRPPIA